MLVCGSCHSCGGLVTQISVVKSGLDFIDCSNEYNVCMYSLYNVHVGMCQMGCCNGPVSVKNG